MTKKNETRTPTSWESVRARLAPVERSAKVCLDGRLIGQIESLNREMVLARMQDEKENRTPVAPQIAKQITALTEKARAAEVEFRFASIGRKAWRDLALEHLPTEDDKKLGADFNTQTFPLAAMAASCVDPVGVDFEELSEKLTQAQWDQLWEACSVANKGTGDVPFIAAAFEAARPTETNSDYQHDSASLEASSSDE